MIHASLTTSVVLANCNTPNNPVCSLLSAQMRRGSCTQIVDKEGKGECYSERSTAVDQLNTQPNALEPGPQGVLPHKNAPLSHCLSASKREMAAEVVPEGKSRTSGGH